MIRLLLVDDHEIVRTGLKAFLGSQEEIQIVGEATNGQEAIALGLQERPDVILMDITMPGIDGLEATRRLKAQWPECRIVALTVHADKQYFFEMLAAGAMGYVTKAAAADELLVAVRAVATDHIYLQPPLALWLLEDYRRLTEAQLGPEQAEAASKGLAVLSLREQQVLECVAQGLTNSIIGTRLGISPKTVARHRERIMGKLDLHTAADLVKFAIRTGLIHLSLPGGVEAEGAE